MTITTAIITIILITFGIAILLMIVRNDWVFCEQVKLISNPRRLEYLSYDMMMLKFWIWDIEKLKKNK